MKLFVFEGLDGCGKTTGMAKCEEAIKDHYSPSLFSANESYKVFTISNKFDFNPNLDPELKRCIKNFLTNPTMERHELESCLTIICNKLGLKVEKDRLNHPIAKYLYTLFHIDYPPTSHYTTNLHYYRFTAEVFCIEYITKQNFNYFQDVILKGKENKWSFIFEDRGLLSGYVYALARLHRKVGNNLSVEDWLNRDSYVQELLMNIRLQKQITPFQTTYVVRDLDCKKCKDRLKLRDGNNEIDNYLYKLDGGKFMENIYTLYHLIGKYLPKLNIQYISCEDLDDFSMEFIYRYILERKP